MNSLSSISPKKILVCQLRQLGDVILATPSIELLKRRYPNAELHLLTEKKCVPLLENNPFIDTVWSLDKKKLCSLFKEVQWYWKVTQTKFDLVIDFQQLPRCRWVVALSKAPIRISYTPPWYTKLLYTHSIKPLDGYSAMSKASILRLLGIEWNGEPPHIYLTQEEKTLAKQRLTTLGLKSKSHLITIDPTHKKNTRRWPITHYIELLKMLVNAKLNLYFLPLWGPGEYKEIQQLINTPELNNCILLPDNMLTLREMSACINEAILHIGNCSAPRHIAVAVDTPSFTILGSTSSAWTYPSDNHRHIQSNLHCQPCNKNTCNISTKCLKLVTPQKAAQAILPFIRQLLT